MGKGSRKVSVRILLGLIALYRRLFSPLFPATCRFIPTCSAYAQEALAKYGVTRGLFLVGQRLLRCHPFDPGGEDPVR